MLWLFDLGGVVEVRQGSPRLGILVGVIAVISNLAQFYYGGPSFGGMSGVVYGLLAYIWVQGKLNPRFGLQLHQYIVYMMLIWFVVCWTGLLGPIANMAHTMGLVMGLILGWAFSPNKKLPI
jgi:GlpG protein